MTKEEYNGWDNYETWNVALWIGNDEGLYTFARQFRNQGYLAFVDALKDGGNNETPIAFQTPDGVSWRDSGLDIDALDEMLGEL